MLMSLTVCSPVVTVLNSCFNTKKFRIFHVILIINTEGHVMDQAVNRHPLIEGPRIKFYFGPCELCGGQIDSSLCK